MIIFFMSQTRITYSNVYKPNVYVKENNDFFFYLEASFWPTISANSGESLQGWVSPDSLGMIRLQVSNFFFEKKNLDDVEPNTIVGELRQNDTEFNNNRKQSC